MPSKNIGPTGGPSARPAERDGHDSGTDAHADSAPRLSARFSTSAATLDQCPSDSQPEVAFVGRSNVGKSSTLNRLTGSRRLARVSKTPGRTQLLNFFDVEGGGRLVDLPGFGYAKASHGRQAAWSKLIDRYLTERANLAAVVLVMDGRHPLQPFERDMKTWAAAAGVPLVVLLNKVDKMKQGERVKAERAVQRFFAELPDVVVLPFSAQTGHGTARAVAAIAAHLGH